MSEEFSQQQMIEEVTSYVFNKYDDLGTDLLNTTQLYNFLNQQYHHILGGATKEDINLVLKHFDTNGDGYLSKQQFKEFIKHILQAK